MADGAPLTFNKVTTLPATLQPDAIYFVQKAGNLMSIVVTSALGVAHQLDVPHPALQMTFGSAGKPAAGKEFGRYFATETIDLADAISGAIADAAATDQTDVDVMRGSEVAARFRWAPGATVAALSILIPTIDPGDLLIFTTPEVQDATLSGITGTLAGFRRIG